LGSALRVTVELAELNGAPAIVSRAADGSATEATILEFDGARIRRIFNVRNSEKLRALNAGHARSGSQAPGVIQTSK